MNNDKINNDEITESQYLNVTYLICDSFSFPMTSSVIGHTAWKSPSLRKPISTRIKISVPNK